MQLRSALRTHRKKNQDCDKLHECKSCEKTFKSSGTFKNHLRWHQVPDTECEYCGKIFSNHATNVQLNANAKLRLHLKACAKARAPKPSQARHKCSADKCAEYFTNLKHRKAHEQKCSLKEWKCELCLRLFVNSRALGNHVKNSCPRRFSAEQVEEPTHEQSQITHQCQLCSNTFDSQKWLNRHNRDCFIGPRFYYENKTLKHLSDCFGSEYSNGGVWRFFCELGDPCPLAISVPEVKQKVKNLASPIIKAKKTALVSG